MNISGPVSLTKQEFSRLSNYIQNELGIKMPDVKKIMLESRLQKRLRFLGLTSFSDYLELIFNSSTENDELIHMIDAVTTNKTDFFREPKHFGYLSEQILPQFYRQGGDFKIWSAGCSSGEEVYTMAMVLQEFRELNSGFRYQILGTDISMKVLKKAINAVYDEDKVEPVSYELKRKYFLRSKDPRAKLVRIKPLLRQKIQFGRLNLMDNDYGLHEKFQVIFCRNVIIYFERPVQEQLITKLYNHLVPGGYLFLGHSETMTGMTLPFESVAPTVYRRTEQRT